MHQTVAEQEQKRKSELKALQAQINPHFLYNTLDSIIWMAEAGNTDEVVEMTSALANLFRTSISKGDEIIPIQVEIDNITSYLTIQKMRYQDKLTYHIDVDDNIKKYKILKVVLQPLVENAILHGVKSKTTNGLIEIGAFETEDAVVFTVTDHGEGMTEEQLKNIFAPKKNTVSRGSGIGVNNVNERIKLYFGEQYGLQFFSRYGEGTTVHVVIPKVI
ncbi:MAG: sensor histidine kinase [Clostridiales bacterium]|nr:sensor histidine kinase [Clostridiales bacterium]